MRWFGILLIVVNLLAAAGFLYVATDDWQGRQAITAMGLRHVLLVQGLPVEPPPGVPDGFAAENETPFVVDMGGGESTKTVGKKVLESYFASVSGGATAAGEGKVALAANTPVTNQVAEVKRVQGLIKAKLGEAGLGADNKIVLLRGWLLFQAENYETRLKYLTLIEKKDAAELEKLLDARFAAALAKPQPVDSPVAAPGGAGTDPEKLEKSAAWRSGAPLDAAQWRTKIAHLLVHLDPDAAWQKRVAAVVGLRRYAKAISAQVLRFADMIAHVELGTAGEQAAFAKQETLLREQATYNAERAKAIAEQRAALVVQKTKKDDEVSREQTQLDELAAQLTKVKAEVDELLVRQTGLEAPLFEIQREVALTLEQVYRLEALLAATERERLGLPPRAEK
jgi:hypothetical protein